MKTAFMILYWGFLLSLGADGMGQNSLIEREFVSFSSNDENLSSSYTSKINVVIDPNNPVQISPKGKAQFLFNVKDAENYVESNPPLFSYRIDDSDWSDFSEKTFASVKDVSSGRHVFQVRAKVGSNELSEIKSMPFTVLTPWYINPDFLFISGCGCLLTLAAILFAVSKHINLDRLVTERTKQLQSLTYELSMVEERERRKIASDLHDHIGHGLATCQMQIDLLKREKLDPRAQELIDNTHETIKSTIEDLRKLTFEISPPVLYKIGLGAAIEWLARQMKKDHGLDIFFEKEDYPETLHSDIKGVLFRSVHELLFNIVKHANTKEAFVTLRRIGEFLHLTVEDKGSGFVIDESKLSSSNKPGFGLFSIRERINHLGGRFECWSTLNRGTRIELMVPFDRNEVFQEQVISTLKFLTDKEKQDVERSYVLDEIRSPALEGNLVQDPAIRPLWVWLPPSYDDSPKKRYPAVYILHHFTGNHTSFKDFEIFDLNVGELAASLIADRIINEAIIVLPDVSNVYGGSFMAKNKIFGDYQTYISEDLVSYIDKKYRTIPDRLSRSLIGHSMGGYCALTLAINYPEVFGGVAAIGPADSDMGKPILTDGYLIENPKAQGEPHLVHTSTDLEIIRQTSFWTNVLYAHAAAYSPNTNNPPYYVDLPIQYPEKTILPEVWAIWREHDLISQIKRYGNNLAHTQIYIDRGIGKVTMMPELHGIELLPIALKEQGVSATYEEVEGDHLSHLRERMVEALTFHAGTKRSKQL